MSLTMENTGVYFVLGGYDPDGDSFISTIRLLPTNGKTYQVLADGVTLGPQITNSGTVLTNPNHLVYYLPNPGIFGQPYAPLGGLPFLDLIRYYDLFDGLEFSDTVTMFIGVSSDNDPPSEAPVTNIGYLDEPVTGVNLDISDPDSDDYHGYITQLPAKGSLYFRGAISPQNLITLSNNQFVGSFGTLLPIRAG